MDGQRTISRPSTTGSTSDSSAHQRRILWIDEGKVNVFWVRTLQDPAQFDVAGAGLRRLDEGSHDKRLDRMAGNPLTFRAGRFALRHPSQHSSSIEHRTETALSLAPNEPPPTNDKGSDGKGDKRPQISDHPSVAVIRQHRESEE